MRGARGGRSQRPRRGQRYGGSAVTLCRSTRGSRRTHDDRPRIRTAGASAAKFPSAPLAWSPLAWSPLLPPLVGRREEGGAERDLPRSTVCREPMSAAALFGLSLRLVARDGYEGAQHAIIFATLLCVRWLRTWAPMHARTRAYGSSCCLHWGGPRDSFRDVDPVGEESCRGPRAVGAVSRKFPTARTTLHYCWLLLPLLHAVTRRPVTEKRARSTSKRLRLYAGATLRDFFSL